MPFVSGFLRLRRRGHPDQGLPGGEEGLVDPDYGIDIGDGGEPDLPDPPPGIWPPLTPDHPWRPIPGFPDRPSTGPVPPGRPPGAPDQGLPGEPPTAGHLPALPPGTIWPPLPPGVSGKFLALVLIGSGRGVHYRYVVVDAGLRPDQGLPPVQGRPDQGLPPAAQPKPV